MPKIVSKIPAASITNEIVLFIVHASFSCNGNNLKFRFDLLEAVRNARPETFQTILEIFPLVISRGFNLCKPDLGLITLLTESVNILFVLELCFGIPDAEMNLRR